MSIGILLIMIAFFLAIIGAAPYPRAIWLLHVSVVLICIALLLESGFVHA